MGIYSPSSTSFIIPYKFNVYRNAAQNVGTADTVVGFDTANFDTGSNVDLVTNKGRFTASVPGFYQFNTNIAVTSAGTGTSIILSFYKNGSIITGGVRQDVGSGLAPGMALSTYLQLAAADFIDVRVGTGAAAKALSVASPSSNTFSGYLVNTA